MRPSATASIRERADKEQAIRLLPSPAFRRVFQGSVVAAREAARTALSIYWRPRPWLRRNRVAESGWTQSQRQLTRTNGSSRPPKHGGHHDPHNQTAQETHRRLMGTPDPASSRCWAAGRRMSRSWSRTRRPRFRKPNPSAAAFTRLPTIGQLDPPRPMTSERWSGLGI